MGEVLFCVTKYRSGTCGNESWSGFSSLFNWARSKPTFGISQVLQNWLTPGTSVGQHCHLAIMVCMLCVAAELPKVQSLGAPEAVVLLPGRSEKRSLYSTWWVNYCFWYHLNSATWIISIRNRMILVTIGINWRNMPWFPCQFSWDLYNCFWTFTPAFARRDLHPLSLSALCPLSPCLPSAMHVIPLGLLCMLDCLQLTFSPRLQSVWLWTEFCLNKKKKNQTFLHPPPYKSKNYRKHKTKPQAFHLFSNASRDVTGNILKIQAEGSFKTSGYCFQSQGSCSKSSEEWTTKANPFRFLCPWWEQQQREGGSASSLRECKCDSKMLCYIWV